MYLVILNKISKSTAQAATYEGSESWINADGAQGKVNIVRVKL